MNYLQMQLMLLFNLVIWQSDRINRKINYTKAFWEI